MPGPIETHEELRAELKKFLENLVDEDRIEGAGLIENEDRWEMGVVLDGGEQLVLGLEFL